MKKTLSLLTSSLLTASSLLSQSTIDPTRNRSQDSAETPWVITFTTDETGVGGYVNSATGGNALHPETGVTGSFGDFTGTFGLMIEGRTLVEDPTDWNDGSAAIANSNGTNFGVIGNGASAVRLDGSLDNDVYKSEVIRFTFDPDSLLASGYQVQLTEVYLGNGVNNLQIHSFGTGDTGTMISTTDIGTQDMALDDPLILSSGDRFSFYNNNGVDTKIAIHGFQLEVVAVPEPSFYAASFGAIVFLGVLIRRRRLQETQR
ncbi:MAG: hypothetical protein ACPGN3_02415 [Opitutales bacterium]